MKLDKFIRQDVSMGTGGWGWYPPSWISGNIRDSEKEKYMPNINIKN
jgi:hypothetical protein